MDYKDVEVKGRQWRIGQFDAMTGSLVVKKLLSVIAGFLDGESLDLDVKSIIKALNGLSDDDFIYMQKACLKVTIEVKGQHFIPVLNENGSFGVIGIETDTATVLALTAHALVFNASSFFDGSPLASIVEGMLGSFQQNAKI